MHTCVYTCYVYRVRLSLLLVLSACSVSACCARRFRREKTNFAGASDAPRRAAPRRRIFSLPAFVVVLTGFSGSGGGKERKEGDRRGIERPLLLMQWRMTIAVAYSVDVLSLLRSEHPLMTSYICTNQPARFITVSCSHQFSWHRPFTVCTLSFAY